MIRSATAWLGALWVGLMIHLDWHLGRPGHDHRSFDLALHWLLAIPAFSLVIWMAHRRWPDAAANGMLLITLLGVLLGQGLEPLGEIAMYGGLEPLTSPVRWRIFAEFMAAGVVTLFLGAALLGRRARGGPPRMPARP